MADVIVFKTAEEATKAIASASQLVSGMSASEAASAMGYKTGAGAITYLKTTVDATVASGAGATATEAIAGATATGGVNATASTTTLYTTSSGATAVGGVAKVALPVAACCLAAYGGYKFGNFLYEQNEEFFDKLCEPLFDFLTDDGKNLPFVFDDKGQAYLPQYAADEIKKMLDEAAESGNSPFIPIDNTKVFASPAINFGTYHFWVNTDSKGNINTSVSKRVELQIWNNTSTVYMLVDVTSNKTGNDIVYHLFSKEPFSFKNHEVYFNNREGWGYEYTAPYYGGAYTDYPFCYSSISLSLDSEFGGQATMDRLSQIPYTFNHGLNLEYNSSETARAIRDVVTPILYGRGLTTPTKLPDGITPYELPENLPSPITVPGTSPTWVPIPLPANPQHFPKPNEFPEFTPDYKPYPNRITPLIPTEQPTPDDMPVITPSSPPTNDPLVIPNPIPNPSPNPTPEPDVDPSQEPDTIPAGGSTPDTPPSDSGSTSTPVLPIVPPIDSEATGLLHVYNPTQNQIDQFGSWLWTTFSGDLIDTLGKIFNNPMDAVIGLHEIYCDVPQGSSTTIKAGFLDSNVASRLVGKRYTEIPCGAITVPEYYGNYLDYSPYTKVYCYLPFIGIVELNADDIIGHGVQIDYRVDIYNGSCIAMISTAKTSSEQGVTYQFSGNCSVDVPITSGSRSAIQGALIGGVVGAVSSFATGGTAAKIVGRAIAGSVSHGMNSKDTVSHSGGFGSSYGAMGIKKPYIIVKRPVQKKVYGYNKNYGYPAHKMVTIGNCSGYLRAIEVDVHSSTATEEEKKRIETLLKEGVYV